MKPLHLAVVGTFVSIALIAPWLWPVLAYWAIEICSDVLNRG